MQYRKFGKLDWDVSALGFGCMRFPIKNGKTDQIDEELAREMLYTSIDGGVNYLDTAYGYHGGKSEGFVGRALKNGYRDKVRLATKMPSWLLKTADDLDRLFEEQLERLQTDHIHFYLLHTLNKKFWKTYLEIDIFPWLEQKRAEGRIDQIGFSFHDNYEVYSEILKAYDWDFVQLQYNYMDTENQAGEQGVRDAEARGIPVIAMEPILGGSLAKEPPASVQKVWDDAPVQRKPADWALQWVWNDPAVVTVLSGMTEMVHVDENLVSAAKSDPLSFTAAEMDTIAKVRDIYNEISPIKCTQCEYCLPCPEELNIPYLFSMLNNSVMYDSYEGRRSWYKVMAEKTADLCSECAACVELCPQQLEIPELMKVVHAVLGEDKTFEGLPS